MAEISSRARARRRPAALAGLASQAACRPEGGDQVVDAVAGAGGGADDRRLPVVAGRSPPSPAWCAGRGPTSWAPGRSLLLTTKMSAISRMPALAAWIESPMPGATTHQRACRPATAISTSAWPTPTVSIRITSKPGGVQDPQRLGGRPGQAAEVPAAGHRPDEHAVVGGVVLHPHPVAEQRAAGERRGRVDRQHADPLARGPVGRGPARRSRWTCRRPGEPVSPMTRAPPGQRRDRPS